jgi:large subunit ribosomal protein L28
VAGRKITRRDKAKYLGGVGRKITGNTKRKFKPNIQKVRAVVDGRVTRVKVSAKAIRIGLVQKPAKRSYMPVEKE